MFKFYVTFLKKNLIPASSMGVYFSSWSHFNWKLILTVFCRIVCEMDMAHADSMPGPVQLCVGECKPELRARSSQLYSFVVWV